MTASQDNGSVMVDTGTPLARAGPGRARRRGAACVAGLVVLALLAACTPRSGEDASTTPATSPYVNEIVSDDPPVLGGSLVYGVPSETSSFNPLLATWASYSLTIAHSFFDALATYDAQGNAVPDLAQSITSNPDYTVWTVKLRPGVTYTNGQPMTAQSVVDMQKAIRSSPVIGVVFDRIAEWQIKDDLTFDVVMNRPWTGYFNAMASQIGTVAWPEWLASDDVTHPIGTGPFIVDRWDVNNEMVLRKNPNYWRKDSRGVAYPYLSGITYKVLTEESVRAEALRDGDIDVMMQSYATPTVASMLQEARAGSLQVFDDKLFEGPEDYVLTNTSKAPLNDVDARKALAHALDLDDYVQTVTGGLDTPATGPWKPGSPWYTEVAYPKYDPAEARRLVAAVKARNGGSFSVSLLGQESTESTRVQQWLRERWAEVGIEVKIETVPQKAKIIKMLQGDFDMVFTQQFDSPKASAETVYWMDWGLPPDALNLNFARITDPTVTSLVDHAASVTGEAEKADFAAIAKRFGELVPFVWLGHATRTVIATGSVVNVVRAEAPDGEPVLQFIQGSHPVYQIWLKR